MIDEKTFDYLQKELEESFAYTLHDKLIFISGLIAEDDEYEPLLNFVNYLLYTEKKEFDILPKLDLSTSNTLFDTNFRNKKCESCEEYLKDVLRSECTKCKYFSKWNFDLGYESKFKELEVSNAK